MEQGISGDFRGDIFPDIGGGRVRTDRMSRSEIKCRLAVLLAERGMKLKELSELVGISETNLSLLKTGKVKAIRFSTLMAICEHLQCQPGDPLTYDDGRRHKSRQ